MKDINEEEIDEKNWKFVFIIIGLLLFGFLIWAIDVFVKPKRQRLKSELDSLYERKQFINHFKEKDIDKLERLERKYANLPLWIRILLVILLLILDSLVVVFLSKPSSDVTTILKDITVWNATLLSVFICFMFITQGKIIKLEEIVAEIRSSIEQKLFNFYFSKVEQVSDSLSSHENNNTQINYRIIQIQKELEKIV